MKIDFKRAINNGLIGALIMCIYGVLAYLFYTQILGSFWIQAGFGFITLGLLIFIPVWGGINYRKNIGGQVKFLEAFLATWIIFAIATTGGSILSWIIPNVVDTEYPSHAYKLVKRTTGDAMEKFGAPQKEIDERLEGMDESQFRPSVKSTLKSIVGYQIFGLILSLIIAAFISRRRSNATLEVSS